jgi:predicted acetyltransferase
MVGNCAGTRRYWCPQRQRCATEPDFDGGHIGFTAVPAYRCQGHAPKMLAAVIPVCRELGLSELLLTAQVDKVGARVIDANVGVLQSM